jgi:hypothetical protein
MSDAAREPNMTRKLHFVGSVPKPLMTDEATVMRWIADQADGGPLTAIPCDLDADWIVDYLRARAEHPDVLEVARAGEFQDYEDLPRYRVIRGRALQPRHVSMGRGERIRAIVSAFESLQAVRPELSNTKIQLSQPNPLDLAMFVFAGAAVSRGLRVGRAVRHPNVVAAALGQVGVFADAMLAEMAEVLDRHGNRIVWQLESPVALLSMVKADQLRLRRAFAPLVARQLADVLGRMDDIGAEVTLHLCYGDLEHRSLLAPRSLRPAVDLLNRVSRLLTRQGRHLPAAHIPCAFGAEAAPLDPWFYHPLHGLDPAWRVIAGVVSVDSAADSAAALSLFENAAGRAAWGVATACGLGRCSVDAACRAAATMRALAVGPASARR